ncbi:RrF2 family transcriptional regulator [Mongoliimonas terrestris]|uniref:RrF2 family transcriptional regulator n=1 Tax=Mongoliimonas terrestris TaxID=1709001 RepID=UPI0009496F14|nr:Rrf2 family transcriptional regulator [Mongoliimonas terrestris]
MISQKSKYALRALLALAESGPRSMSAAEIAENERIPKKFLEQILVDLKRDGLVQARRGAAGGYLLLRPADTITFGHVLRLVDGPIAPLPCLSRTAYRRCEDCRDEAACRIRKVFSEVANSARRVLDHTTIADALSEPALLRSTDPTVDVA